jgi:hypothetical protein
MSDVPDVKDVNAGDPVLGTRHKPLPMGGRRGTGSQQAADNTRQPRTRIGRADRSPNAASAYQRRRHLPGAAPANRRRHPHPSLNPTPTEHGK